jgi:hypothetical protein
MTISREINMNPLTPERIAEIEKRCNAATAGPWWIAQSGYNCTGPRAVSHHNATVEETQPLPIYSEKNMDFIANSITDIPDLLNEIKRLRARETKRDGNWLDGDGCCKVCDGEIPHGHGAHCDIYKLEQAQTERNYYKDKNDQLSAQLSDAQAALKVAIDAIENVQADHNEPTSNDGADYRPCDCEICKINTAALQPKE